MLCTYRQLPHWPMHRCNAAQQRSTVMNRNWWLPDVVNRRASMHVRRPVAIHVSVAHTFCKMSSPFPTTILYAINRYSVHSPWTLIETKTVRSVRIVWWRRKRHRNDAVHFPSGTRGSVARQLTLLLVSWCDALTPSCTDAPNKLN